MFRCELQDEFGNMLQLTIRIETPHELKAVNIKTGIESIYENKGQDLITGRYIYKLKKE
jgi:hypothetical protein